jgi:hypothetical protein
MSLTDANVDETMAADWAGIREKFKEEIPETIPEAPEPEAPKADATPAQESAEDRGDGRRSDGTFVGKAKENEAGPPAVKQNPSPAEAPAQEPVVGTKGAPVDITKPPSTWKPVARAEFAKLPESVRAEIHRRETDALNGQAQLLPDARFGKSVNEVVAPYLGMIQAEGGTPERAIADLMRTAALFRTGSPQAKQQALLQIAQQFRIELPGTQPAAPNGQPSPTFQDPRVDQLLQHLQTQEQQRLQQEQQQLEATVTRWMDAKDETGVSKYPYLGDVMNDMAVLVPQIRAGNSSLSHEQVLQSAYERATWASPDVRPLLMAAQAAEPARDAANQTRVREAKRAASVNVPRRASAPSPAKPGKMEDTIEETARTLGFIS